MKKFTLTPIGTCRINNPIKRARGNFPFQGNFSRVYGYTHTAGEALQQVLYLQGDKVFSGVNEPAIFRPGFDLASGKVTHKQSDLYLVEISSAKKLTAGNDLLQLNYLYRHFSNFFADDNRTRTYWGYAVPGKEAELVEFLKKDPVYLSLSTADQELLASIRMTISSYDEIREEMRQIVQRLGQAKVIFVTHVNAKMPDGKFIRAREQLVNDVKKIAEELGVPCFDPTPAMNEYGQQKALESEGLDLTHYTDAFSDLLFKKWFVEYMAPMFGIDAKALTSSEVDAQTIREIADEVYSKLASGSFFEASRQLFAAMRQYPKTPLLILLQGEINCQIGNYSEALADVAKAEAVLGQTDQGNRTLMRAHLGLGAWKDALTVAMSMLGDEIEDAEVFEVAAHASEKSGQLSQAFDFWKKTLRLKPDHGAAWLQAMTILDQIGSDAEVRTFFEQAILSAPNEPELAKIGLEIGVKRVCSDTISVAMRHWLQIDPTSALDRLKSLSGNVALDAAVHALLVVVNAQKPSALLPADLLTLATGWLDRAKQLNEKPELAAEAYALAKAAHSVAPNREASLMCSAIEKQWRNAVRSAYQEQKYAEVLSLTENAGALLIGDRYSPILCARSLVALGNPNKACEVLLAAVRKHPHDNQLRLLCARASLNVEDVTVALRTFGEMMAEQELTDSDTRTELAKLQAVMTRKAIPKIRTLVSEHQLDLAWELCDLVDLYAMFDERVARERKLILKALKDDLRHASEEESSPEERLAISLSLLDKEGTYAYALKCAAVDLMLLKEFGRALSYWRRLEEIAGSLHNIKSQIDRCVLLAERGAGT